MEKDKNDVSPFAALSYQEQQDRWLEWRSRQLEYRSIPPEEEADRPEFGEKGSDRRFSDPPSEAAPPSVSVPVIKNAAPTRHRELDAVLKRHESARRQAVHFITVTQENGGSARSPANEPDTPHS